MMQQHEVSMEHQAASLEK